MYGQERVGYYPEPGICPERDISDINIFLFIVIYSVDKKVEGEWVNLRLLELKHAKKRNLHLLYDLNNKDHKIHIYKNNIFLNLNLSFLFDLI